MACIINPLTGVLAKHVIFCFMPQNDALKSNVLLLGVEDLVNFLKNHFCDE